MLRNTSSASGREGDRAREGGKSEEVGGRMERERWTETERQRQGETETERQR